MTALQIEVLNSRNDVADLYRIFSTAPGLTTADRETFEQYQPGSVLIVYGSLAPGKSNHHVVTNIRGNWRTATIKGKLENKGWAAGSGFPAFRPAPDDESELIQAWVLFADKLPDHWARLDEFEGDEYRRILAGYDLDDRNSGVGYIYALNE